MFLWLLKTLLPFIPILSRLPKLELPDWVWPTLLAILTLLGFYIHMERTVRRRARTEWQARENRRIAEELRMRDEMERRSDTIWSERPSSSGELDSLLRSGAF